MTQISNGLASMPLCPPTTNTLPQNNLCESRPPVDVFCSNNNTLCATPTNTITKVLGAQKLFAGNAREGLNLAAESHVQALAKLFTDGVAALGDIHLALGSGPSGSSELSHGGAHTEGMNFLDNGVVPDSFRIISKYFEKNFPHEYAGLEKTSDRAWAEIEKIVSSAAEKVLGSESVRQLPYVKSAITTCQVIFLMRSIREGKVDAHLVEEITHVSSGLSMNPALVGKIGAKLSDFLAVAEAMKRPDLLHLNFRDNDHLILLGMAEKEFPSLNQYQISEALHWIIGDLARRTGSSFSEYDSYRGQAPESMQPIINQLLKGSSNR